MRKTMRTDRARARLGIGSIRNLAGSVLCALVALTLAAPAGAKIVEFNSLFKAGLGDGGDPTFSDTSYQPNGLPACSKGIITHLNNSAVGHGFVEVSSGAAPQSIMSVRPFKYGTAGPLGPSPTFSMMGMPGVNGAAKVYSSTCTITFPPQFLPAILNSRAQSERASWPAYNSFHLSTVPTMNPTGAGSAVRNVVGTGLEVHHLAAGRGPGSFNVQINPAITHRLTGMAGANTFGGGFRASGGGRVNINANLVPGVFAVGYWLSGPRIAGHNRTGPPLTGGGMASTAITQRITRSGTFTTNLASGMIFVELKAWNLPWTTGTVMAEDHDGAVGDNFTTIRTTTGYDNRTPNGELGTLLLVTPWGANLEQLTISFGGTASLKFEFLPEPGPTALFAAGVLGIFALHIAIRRRK